MILKDVIHDDQNYPINWGDKSISRHYKQKSRRANKVGKVWLWPFTFISRVLTVDHFTFCISAMNYPRICVLSLYFPFFLYNIPFYFLIYYFPIILFIITIFPLYLLSFLPTTFKQSVLFLKSNLLYNFPESLSSFYALIQSQTFVFF